MEKRSQLAFAVLYVPFGSMSRRERKRKKSRLCRLDGAVVVVVSVLKVDNGEVRMGGMICRKRDCD